jgi:thiamine pyrophosphokinase
VVIKHINTEGKLLGIIFTGGLGPSAQITRRLIEKQDALFIAADSGLEAAEEAGVKPDWIIGDMDSLKDLSSLNAYPPECVIRHGREKDFTDTELAFSLAVEKGYNEIWIIGGGGGRTDHLFAIRSLFERDVFPCRWITDAEDIRCIDAISNEELGIRNEKMSPVSVFPLGLGPWEAKSSGLKWPLEGLPWERGFFGLSNVAVDGDFSIIAKKGRFMVILTHELI